MLNHEAIAQLASNAAADVTKDLWYLHRIEISVGDEMSLRRVIQDYLETLKL